MEWDAFPLIGPHRLMRSIVIRPNNLRHPGHNILATLYIGINFFRWLIILLIDFYPNGVYKGTCFLLCNFRFNGLNKLNLMNHIHVGGFYFFFLSIIFQIVLFHWRSVGFGCPCADTHLMPPSELMYQLHFSWHFFTVHIFGTPRRFLVPPMFFCPLAVAQSDFPT